MLSSTCLPLDGSPQASWVDTSSISQVSIIVSSFVMRLDSPRDTNAGFPYDMVRAHVNAPSAGWSERYVC